VDAVFVLLPDHWHAYASYLALESGKHVYVEKPCSHSLGEGEMFLSWQNRYGKRIQIGTQQRSSPESTEIIAQIHAGIIGTPYLAKAFYSNQRGRVPNSQKVDVPEHLNWELFQGPAPRRPFLDIVEDYNWHWFWHWGTAETGNNATHELDIARWALQVTYPKRVMVNSGKYHFVDDGWTMYDTMEATYQYPGGASIQWDGKSRNGYSTYGAGRGTLIYGTDGSVFVDRGGYRLYSREGNLIKEKYSGGDEQGVALGGGGGMTDRHVRNFADSIRDGKALHAPIDEGVISTDLCHYANISSREQDAVIDIDPSTGRLKDPQLMQRYWNREYQSGWEPKI